MSNPTVSSGFEKITTPPFTQITGLSTLPNINNKYVFNGMTSSQAGCYYANDSSTVFVFQCGTNAVDASGTIIIRQNSIVKYYLVGGGGSGGTNPNYYGGGGGSYNSNFLFVNADTSLNLSVGAGGFKGKGHDTSINSISAPGGVFNTSITDAEKKGKNFTDMLDNIYFYGGAGGNVSAGGCGFNSLGGSATSNYGNGGGGGGYNNSGGNGIVTYPAGGGGGGGINGPGLSNSGGTGGAGGAGGGGAGGAGVYNGNGGGGGGGTILCGGGGGGNASNNNTCGGGGSGGIGGGGGGSGGLSTTFSKVGGSGGAGGGGGGGFGLNGTLFGNSYNSGGVGGVGGGGGGAGGNSSLNTSGGQGGSGLIILNIFPIQYNLTPISYQNNNSVVTNYNVNGQNNWTSVTPNGPPQNLYATACSSSGQYVYACSNTTNNSTIYYSSNYGVSWTTNTSAFGTSAQWSSIACSSSGRYVYVCGSNTTTTGKIFCSSNYGSTWTEGNPPTGTVFNALNSIACSASGYSVYVCGNGGQFFYNNNYGSTNFSILGLTNGSEGNTTSILSSIAAGNNTSSIAIYICSNSSNEIWYNNGSYLRTTLSPATERWNDIACSGLGQYAYVCGQYGNICYTYSSGLSWTLVSSGTNGLPSNESWGSIRCSTSGQYIFVCGKSLGYICFNNNYGSGNWMGVAPTTYGLPQTIVNWSRLALPSSGQSVYVCGKDSNSTNSYIYFNSYSMDIAQILAPITDLYSPVTTNYIVPGTNTWYDTSGNSNLPSSVMNWTGIATSSSGQFVAVCSNEYAPASYICTNNNYGKGNWRLWALNQISGLPSNQLWGRLSISKTGQYLYVAGSQSYVVLYNYLTDAWRSIQISGTGSTLWLNIATSASGKSTYICGAVYIYTNQNFGTDSWVSVSNVNVGSTTWNGIATSNSGQFVAAASNNGIIATHNNYGTNTTTISWNTYRSGTTAGLPTGTINWVSITVSSSGQYIAACDGADDNGYVSISNNFGITWNSIQPGTKVTPNITRTIFHSITISSSGQYIAVCGYTNKIVLTNSNYGIGSWTNYTFDKNVHDIAISSSGQYLMVAAVNAIPPRVYIYNQSMDIGSIYEGITDVYGPSITNYNVANPGSWSKVDTRADWFPIAMSSSGQYIAACTYSNNLTNNYGIYMSTNYGASWSRVYNIDKNFSCITMSSSGQYIAACTYNDGIYKSSDFGNTWSATNAGLNLEWSSIAISSSGQYMAACIRYNSVASGKLYLWTNYWNTGPTAINTASASDVLWSSLTISDTGTYINACLYGYAGGSGGGIFTINSSSPYSTNMWNDASSVAYWKSIASSSSGQYVVACTDGTIGTTGGIYLSTKYGSLSGNNASGVWYKVFNVIPTTMWSSIAMSSSGQYIAACIYEGTSGANCGIYLSSNYGATGSWRQINSTVANWTSIAMSSTGQYIAACADNRSNASASGIYLYKQNIDFGSMFSVINQ